MGQLSVMCTRNGEKKYSTNRKQDSINWKHISEIRTSETSAWIFDRIICHPETDEALERCTDRQTDRHRHTHTHTNRHSDRNITVYLSIY